MVAYLNLVKLIQLHRAYLAEIKQIEVKEEGGVSYGSFLGTASTDSTVQPGKVGELEEIAEQRRSEAVQIARQNQHLFQVENIFTQEDMNVLTNTKLAFGTAGEEAFEVVQYNTHLEDIDFLYNRSFTELATEFREGFRRSTHYKEMVLLLNQNIIEYRFMR